jgi:phage baseplate assembly protein W
MSRSMVSPFRIVGGSVASTTDPVRIIEQKIVNVLVTMPLERLAFPTYGSGVQQLLFDDIDELVEADFKLDASQDLTSSINNITVLDIVVEQTEESRVEITVVYRTPLSTIRTTTFQVAIPGFLTEETEI